MRISYGTLRYPHLSYTILMSDDDDGSGEEGGGDRPVSNSVKVDTTKREKRQPPITIPHTLVETVNNALADCACILKLLNETIKVVTYSRAMYDKSLAALKTANINYYTHDSAGEDCVVGLRAKVDPGADGRPC